MKEKDGFGARSVTYMLNMHHQGIILLTNLYYTTKENADFRGMHINVLY